MTPQQTFYLSRSVGCRLVDKNGLKIGIVTDILVNTVVPATNTDEDLFRPQVVGLKVKADGQKKILDFKYITYSNAGGKYRFVCTQASELAPDSVSIALPLATTILDRQIVDINGRKLVRVNDVRLVSIAAGTYAIAVDIGTEGLLRRLGVAKPISKVLRLFGKSIPTQFILWDEVDAFDTSNFSIKLSSSNSKLQKLHPSDLADIIEEMGVSSRKKIFEEMDEEKAADVLEELEPYAQAQVIESLSVSKAADLLEKMPADEVADLFDELEDDKVEELLNEMEKESSEEVRELLEYDKNEVGSLMTTDFMCFHETTSVADTLTALRRDRPEADMIYSLFVVDENEHLVATVSLRDLVVSQPELKLSEIMNTDFISVHDEDQIDTLAMIILKYDLLAIPVVDSAKVLIGMVVIDDIVEDLMLKGKTKKGGRAWR